MATDRQARAGAGEGFEPGEGTGAAAGKRALTDHLVRRAVRKNPTLAARHGFTPAAFSPAPVDSAEFAHDVADRQSASGLKVDGIVGPRTQRAVTGVDPFDFLAASGKGPRAAGGPATRAPTRVVLGEITDRQELDRGSRLVANVGLEDGADHETGFAVCYASGRPVPSAEVTIVQMNMRSTVLRCSLNLLTLPEGALVQVTLREPTPHGDGSLGDDDDGDRLEA